MNQGITEQNKKYWNKKASIDDFYSAGAPGEGNRLYRRIMGKYRTRTEFNHIDNKIDLRGKLLLDLGCGSGRTTLSLAKRCKKVIGIDFSEGLIGIAKEIAEKKKIQNAEFYVTELQNLKIEEKFDIIHLGGVLMCIPDEDLSKIANQIKGVIKDDGILINRDTVSLLDTRIEPQQTSDIYMYSYYRTVQECKDIFSQNFHLFYSNETYPITIFVNLYNRLPKFLKNSLLILWMLDLGMNIQSGILDPFLQKRKHLYAKVSKKWNKRQYFFFYKPKLS